MSNCLFCKSEINKNRLDGQTIYGVDCPVCGYYRMTDTALECQPQGISTEDLLLFSGYLRNSSPEENPVILYSEDLNKIQSIIAPYKRLTVVDKINLFLRFLGDSSKFLGDRIQIEDGKLFTKFYCTEKDEIVRIWNYLESRGLVTSSPWPFCELSVDGWQAYQSLNEINIQSKKVFVAMSFADDLKPIFNDYIFPACEECGFKAFRVDSEEHTQKICDKIVADIKESRFLIADFTGQKHGVYFEAGFARGLGLEVIWTCKEEDKDNLHFDTRQYSHIFWKDGQDLKQQLINKIKAVIK